MTSSGQKDSGISFRTARLAAPVPPVPQRMWDRQLWHPRLGVRWRWHAMTGTPCGTSSRQGQR